MSDRYEGDYVSLRVSNDEANELVSMAVDTVTDYVQGSVKSFTYAKDQNDITPDQPEYRKSTTYDISSKAAIPLQWRGHRTHERSGTLLPPASGRDRR